MSRWISLGAFALLLQFSLLAPAAEPPAAVDAATTRQIMHRVFDAIAYLLPLSVRAGSSGSHWDRELIEQKLSALEQAADALQTHAAGGDQAFRGLARSFRASSHDVATSFREVWPSYAYFSLMELTQHCVACHGRLPAEAQPGFGQRLMARVDTAGFDESELAQLYVATRQFDAALGVLERKLLKPDGGSAIELDSGGVLLDYLEIALVVQRDPLSAQSLLARFDARPDVPRYLSDRLRAWRKSLRELAPMLAGEAELAPARRLVLAADHLTRAPHSRARAIHDLVAMSLLQRYVASPALRPPADLAEAWYLLGVISLRTLEPKYSVPEMEILLAASIRAAPHGPRAREAYNLLEEFGYWHDQPLSQQKGESALINMAELRHLMAKP